MNLGLWTTLLTLCGCVPLVAAQTNHPRRIAPLIDSAKFATLSPRQLDIGRKFQKAGLLSAKGLRAVEAASGSR
jgi:hypothetical protein